MAKRKSEIEPEDIMEAQQQETIDTAKSSVEISNTVPDRMAKARAAKTQKPADENGHKPKGADMAYVIVGSQANPPMRKILGIVKTRGQCRKRMEAIGDLVQGMYDEVFIVKGKRIEVDSL